MIKGELAVNFVEDGFGVDAAFLAQFVLVARLDLLCERTWDEALQRWVRVDAGDVLTREQLGEKMGWTKKDISEALNHPFGGLRSTKKLRGHSRVDHRNRLFNGWRAAEYLQSAGDKTTIGRLESDLRMFAARERGASADAIAELSAISSFWQEAVGSAETAFNVNVHEARWFRDLAECGPQNSAEALIGGQALLSLLGSAHGHEDAQKLIDLHAEAVTRVVRGLMTVATKPPTKGVLPALNQLALLGALRVLPNGTVADLVVEHYLDSPVGFRAIRVLTKMVTLSSRREVLPPPWWSDAGRNEIEAAAAALDVVLENSDRDPYPARSLAVECLRSLRLTSDPRYAEQALRRLEERAKDPSRPVRERSYAAYCAYRALRNNAHDRIESVVNGLTQQIADAEADPGLRYAAQVIQVLLSGEPNSRTLAELLMTRKGADTGLIERFEFDMAVLTVDSNIDPAHVIDQPTAPDQPSKKDHIDSTLTDVPARVRMAFRSLLRYALLTVDGSGRRRVLEALRDAGLGDEASTLVGAVLLDAQSPRWLREQSAFVLGYLSSDVGVAPLAQLLERQTPSSEPPSVRHAALWALGDIGRPTPEAIKVAVDIADRGREEVGVMRAATYAIAVLLGSAHDPDAARLRTSLEALSEHSDDLVSHLARWGLVDQARRTARMVHRSTDDLWGVPPELRSTLRSI